MDFIVSSSWWRHNRIGQPCDFKWDLQWRSDWIQIKGWPPGAGAKSRVHTQLKSLNPRTCCRWHPGGSFLSFWSALPCVVFHFSSMRRPELNLSATDFKDAFVIYLAKKKKQKHLKYVYRMRNLQQSDGADEIFINRVVEQSVHQIVQSRQEDICSVGRPLPTLHLRTCTNSDSWLELMGFAASRQLVKDM